MFLQRIRGQGMKSQFLEMKTESRDDGGDDALISLSKVEGRRHSLLESILKFIEYHILSFTHVSNTFLPIQLGIQIMCLRERFFFPWNA
jgi:hypothetical protein